MRPPSMDESWLLGSRNLVVGKGYPLPTYNIPLTSQQWLSLNGWQKRHQSLKSDCRCSTSNCSVVQEDFELRRSRRGRLLTADTVRKLCELGQVVQAVEGLGLLVQTGDSCIPQSLLYAVLKKCGLHRDLCLGRRVHALILKGGYESDTFLCNHILRMYAAHGRLEEAREVFTLTTRPDAFTWSSIISAHVKHNQDKEGIELYHQMRRSSLKPDGHVFAAVLQACAGAGDLKSGQQVHADVLASGVRPDMFVCNGLVDMYAKCGNLDEARRVFDGLARKDVVTWTALIAGYAQQGMGQEALLLHSVMQQEGVAVQDSVTFVSLLQACASVGAPALETGRQLHVQIGERGFQTDVKVSTSLVNMYAKCGSLEDAQRVFDGLRHKNVATWTALIAGHAKCGSLDDAERLFDGHARKDLVMWNAMIAAYSQQGMGQEALRIYRSMQEEGIFAPNARTFVCLLQACANVAALELGRELHSHIKEQGLEADVLLAGSLINMYAKSGSIVDAQHVFDAMPQRDVVAWNALITGYSRQGDDEEVFGLFHRMGEEGIQPTGLTFLSVLTLCSHAGLVNKGQELFDAMSKYHGISPTVEHYICMVDLLARAGQLDEALGVVKAMPVPPIAAVWHAILGACRKWSNVEAGRHAFEEAVKLDEKDEAAYVLMSNIYNAVEMWEQAEELRLRRTAIGAWKAPGQSWWTDLNGQVHTFVVGDKTHPETEALYAMLDLLISKMETQGAFTRPRLDVREQSSYCRLSCQVCPDL